MARVQDDTNLAEPPPPPGASKQQEQHHRGEHATKTRLTRFLVASSQSSNGGGDDSVTTDRNDSSTCYTGEASDAFTTLPGEEDCGTMDNLMEYWLEGVYGGGGKGQETPTPRQDRPRETLEEYEEYDGESTASSRFEQHSVVTQDMVLSAFVGGEDSLWQGTISGGNGGTTRDRHRALAPNMRSVPIQEQDHDDDDDDEEPQEKDPEDADKQETALTTNNNNPNTTAPCVASSSLPIRDTGNKSKSSKLLQTPMPFQKTTSTAW